MQRRQKFWPQALGLFVILQAIAWALCFTIHSDWVWKSNLLGSAALLWLMLTLLFLYPRHATPQGKRRATRLWMAAAPVVVVALVEWLHIGPIMFASTGTAIAALLFAAMMVLIFALCGRSRPAQIFVAILWWALALASNIKTAFRGTPLVPWDVYALSTAMDVVGGYTPHITREMIGSFVGLALYCVVCWRYPLRIERLARQGIALVLSLVVLGGMGTSLLMPASPLYIHIPTNNWVLSTAYRHQGFATALIANFKQLMVTRPSEYDPEVVRELLAQAQAPVFPNVMPELPINIVVIMNEAFADLEALAEFEINRPVYPNLRALSEVGMQGRVNLSVFGGGTSITEFELLTGHSAAFLPAESAPYVQFLQPSRHNGYSLAWLLKGQGYKTLAVHPAEPGNWKRDEVYPLLGFDDFLSLRDMPGWDDPANNLRGMYTDAALYDELLRLLREKPVGQRLFIHCITMQNHGGYLQPEFDAIQPRIDLVCPNNDPLAKEISNYLTLAGLSDWALGEFAMALEELEEPTLLLFFGDHQPTVSRLLTRWAEGSDRWFAEPEARAELFVTPLLIWSNKGLTPTDIGDTSVQYLGVLLTQVAGLPLSDYQRFLAALSRQWPVFTAKAARDAAGVFHTSEEALSQSAALRSHQAIQYNLLLDDRHRLYRFPE
ncbi:MAG: LTA synthase family protein [Clostridia bacterium]|nr:LTA synthase family protein [Clostridia bacterium]